MGFGDIARDHCAFEPKLSRQRIRQLAIEIVHRVRERAEHEDLSVLFVEGAFGLLLDELSQDAQFLVALGRDLAGVAKQLLKHADVVVDVLPELQSVEVGGIHMYLRRGAVFREIVLVVEHGRVYLRHVMLGDELLRLVQHPLGGEVTLVDALKGDAERVDGALKALEQVHPHEVGHGMGAVDLAVEVAAPRVAVHVHVLLLASRHHVGELLILRKRERRDHVVELGYGGKLSQRVDGRVERYGLAALGEFCVACGVVLVDVLAAARDSEHVEQLEVVGVHGVHE